MPERIGRSAALMVVLVAVLLMASVVPAFAATSWQPTGAKNRYGAEPRAWDNHNPVNGIPNGGGSGGQFPDNGQHFAVGTDGTTHYRYAVWVGDRGAGNEQQALVPYGGASLPSTKAGENCALDTNPLSRNAATQRSISSITWSGGTLTITLAGGQAGHRFMVGDHVWIEGASPAGYNTTTAAWTVLSNISGTQLTTTGPGSNPGTYTGTTGTIVRTGAYCANVYFARTKTERAVDSTITITNAVKDGNGAAADLTRYTTSAAHGINPGDPVNIWGTGVPELDGAFTAVACASAPAATKLCVPTAAVYGKGVGTATTSQGTLYRSTWVWDGGSTATGPCANATLCNQYGADAYPVSPSNFHVQSSGVAAAGANVYVIYSTTYGYYRDMCQGQPRTLYVRVNRNYGAADAWDASAVRLSPTNGKVGYATVAAWDRGTAQDAYVAWTNSETGAIMVATSHSDVNAGAFSTVNAGSTKKIYDGETMPAANPPPGSKYNCAGDAFGDPPISSPNPPFDGISPSIEGFDGVPNIAGNGTHVGLIYLDGRADESSARVKAKISATNGDSWPTGSCGAVGASATTCTLILTNNGGSGSPPGTCTTMTITGGGSAGGDNCSASNQAVDATTGRIGFLWADGISTGPGAFSGPRGLYYREWNTSGWTPARLAGCMDSNIASCTSGAGTPMANNYVSGYSPSVVLYGTTGVGFATSACPNAACNYPEILWRESGNNGAVWHDGCAGNNCGRYRTIAGNAWDISEATDTFNNTGTGCPWGAVGGCLNSAVNQYPSVEMDMSTGASTGCASTGTHTNQSGASIAGAPASNCKRFVYFLGRDTYYMYYRMYVTVGTSS